MIRFTLNLPDSYGPRLNARLKATGHKKVAYARWLIARDLGLVSDAINHQSLADAAERAADEHAQRRNRARPIRPTI